MSKKSLKVGENILKIELTKYFIPINIVIIVFYIFFLLLQVYVLFNHRSSSPPVSVKFKSFLEGSFSYIISSVLPLTIIIQIATEFNKGYTSKLLCNGYTRDQYYLSKIILSICVAIGSLLFLYVSGIFVSLFYFHNVVLDQLLVNKYIVTTFFNSILFNSLALCMVFFIPRLIDSIVFYILYSILESTITMIWGNTITILKFLPFTLGRSMTIQYFTQVSYTQFAVEAAYIVLLLICGRWKFRKTAL